MLLVDAIVVEDEVINEVHHLLLQPHVEGLCELLIAHEARQELKSVLLGQEAALSIKVVCLEPGSQTTEERILHREGVFALELASQVDCSTFAGEFLHLPIIRHDRRQEVARGLAHLLTPMSEYQT